jgi:tetratricopeptide (TPR) repeat protein
MDVETALNFVDDLIYKQTGQNLNDLERDIFRGVWENKTYKIIAEQIYSTKGSLKHPATALWKKISGVLGQEVSNKGNKIKSVIERKYREIYGNQGSESVSLSNNSDNKQDACTTAEIAEVPLFKGDLGGSDPNFVGREDAIARLNHLMNKNSSTGILRCHLCVTRICQIVATGQGKTTLAKKYLKNNFKTVLEFTIAKETKDIASVESLLEEKLRHLGEEPGREFMVSLDRFKQKLQTQPIGILIDNLEPALKLDGSGQFLPEHRRYLELLRVLSDSSLQSLTLITSRERLNEGLDITLYSLPSLTVSAWGEFWQYQGINNHITLLTEIHKAYGGNALAMKVLSNLINNDYQGDMVAYWQDNKTEDNLIVETAVANLIKEQFERLQNINLDAYNLLCRLGCYRYQDVPTVPEAGLNCLLWDVAENQHKRIIRVLKERTLVEFNNGDYWLHPVIREVAINRLRNSDDWEKANTQAAEFWTESVKIVETVKDALTAFEAYYHYLGINNIEKAVSVICKERQSNFCYFETLNRSFYRLGLLDKMNQIIQIILTIENIDEKIYVSELYNAIGSFCVISGKVHEAIEFYKQGQESAIKNKYNVFILLSIINLGLCYLAIFEIETSIDMFSKSLQLINSIERLEQNREKSEMILICYFCLALLYSLSNDNENAIFYTDIAYKHMNCNSKLSFWTQAHSLLYLGLSYKHLHNIEKSSDLYWQAINYAKES